MAPNIIKYKNHLQAVSMGYFLIVHWLKKRLMEGMGHSIHCIVYVIAVITKSHVKCLCKQPFKWAVGRAVPQCLTHRSRDSTVKVHPLQPCQVFIWVFERVYCLDKIFKTRNLSMVLCKSQSPMEQFRREVTLTCSDIELWGGDPDSLYTSGCPRSKADT